MLSGGGISSVSADTAPQLGGDLDVNGHEIKSTSASYDLTLSSLGTYYIKYNAVVHKFGIGTGEGVLTTPSSHAIRLNTNDGANSGSIVVQAGANANIELAPNGTGKTLIKNPYPQETLVNNGNSGTATITPNAANGSVQKYTLTGNITWNAFASPVAGQSITMFLVQDATGSRTLTSTGIKWAGGVKTLSTAANSVDIATVYYDGTNYYGSLGKGFV